MNMGSETPNTSIPQYQVAQGDGETDTDKWMTDESLIHAHVISTSKCSHVLPYDRPLPATVFSINLEHPHANVRAFRQRVQLLGPNSYAVRGTAQVDDGAMRNCIGRHVWSAYGHCLGELKPSPTYISVANGHEVRCDGAWSGEIRIGGTTSFTHFEVFDCGYAFDIILGKPWLQEVHAVHDYATDTIQIPSTLANTTITNITNLEQPMDMTTDATGAANTDQTAGVMETPPTPNVNMILPPNGCTLAQTTITPKSLDDLLSDEMQRIEHLHKENNQWAESRWARYLDVEPMDEDDECDLPSKPSGVQWFTTKAEQRDILRAARREKPEDAKMRRRAQLQWLTDEALKNRDIHMLHSTNTPTEASTDHMTDQDYTTKWRERRMTLALIEPLKATEADPIEAAAAQRLIASEQRIATLRLKLQQLRELAIEHQPNGTNLSEVHMANTVTGEDFQIDRGENKSSRITDPFAPGRVEEILQKVEIGNDLTNDQREQVHTLIREYADVFALSLSEVRVVDWYKHHLNIDPSVKLPRHTSQRPVTEAQKDWFFNILDEMENAHVIQKVPSSFIKALSSTNLAAKEAGKLGTTRTEILRKGNA